MKDQATQQAGTAPLPRGLEDVCFRVLKARGQASRPVAKMLATAIDDWLKENPRSDCAAGGARGMTPNILETPYTHTEDGSTALPPLYEQEQQG